jgi:hypothetical protein
MSREWTNRHAVHRLDSHDFAVLVAPDDGELQKSLCKFCLKLPHIQINIIILSGAPF